MINYFKSAIKSIWSNKARSFLTTLGIIIGVTSVTLLVSLGQGLQKDMSNLIQGLGTNVLVVLSGKIEMTSSTSMTGSNSNMNPASLMSQDILSIEDVKLIEEIAETKTVTPMSLVSRSNLKYKDKTLTPMTIGTYPNILESFELITIDRGKGFESNDAGNVIVVGPGLKKELFGDEDAVGKKVTLNNEDFEIIGVTAQPTSTSMFASEFDFVAVLPYDTATKLNEGEESVYRIIIKADEDADVNAFKTKIEETLKNSHDGEEDFTVFTQDDLLEMFEQFLGMATALVSAIAAISLIVGGIGIMNIMLVTVTERTKEIGLRKAIGATKGNILAQFLVESIIITLLGGFIGLGLAFAGGIAVASQTPLTPSITPTVILIAVGVSVFIGIVFGIWPALVAAKKDPIEALRHE